MSGSGAPADGSKELAHHADPGPAAGGRIPEMRATGPGGPGSYRDAPLIPTRTGDFRVNEV
jgi:hypothetical protein